MTNVVLRRGGDPRDFTLVAYGAAGPMLLPAALDLLHVRRVVVPPHPGNFSALGLLSTDLVYYDSRSAYVPLFPDVGGADRGRVRRRWSADCASAPAGTARCGAASTGGSSARAGRRRSCRSRTGRSTIADLVERFHETYERRYGNRFPYIPVQGVSYRVELRVPSEKVEFAPLTTTAGEAPADADDRAPPLRRRAARGRGVRPRTRCRPARAIAGPAVIREGLATTFVVPGQTAEVGTLGELGDRGGRVMRDP